MSETFDPYPPRQTARVILECGHIRLMRWTDAIMGVGSRTRCHLCPKVPASWRQPGEVAPARRVVSVEDALTHWFSDMASFPERETVR